MQNRVAGCDVMAEDWDNLLILDACRFDMFERANTIPGRLESRRSKGSATLEFVRNNFAGERHYDTVYVTGNPFVSTDAGDAFHDLYEVWRTDWDDELGTVRPEPMCEAVLRANEAYPNKRLVGHLMQPHHPFIGPTGRELLDDPAPDVVISEFGSSSVVLTCRFWIYEPSIGRKWEAQNAMVGAVKAAFERQGIDIPFPQRTVSSREAVGIPLAHRDVSGGPGTDGDGSADGREEDESEREDASEEDVENEGDREVVAGSDGSGGET